MLLLVVREKKFPKPSSMSQCFFIVGSEYVFGDHSLMPITLEVSLGHVDLTGCKYFLVFVIIIVLLVLGSATRSHCKDLRHHAANM